MAEYTFPNSEKLREIETVFDQEFAVAFRKTGRVCLRRSVSRDPEFVQKRLKVQNTATGEIAHIPENRTTVAQYTCKITAYPEDLWPVVEEYEVYPRDKPEGVSTAYYVLPENPKQGERFFIPRIIEDIYVTSFWEETFLAGCCIAIWNGYELELETSALEDAIMIG